MNIQFFYRGNPPSELLWYGIPHGPWYVENLDYPGYFQFNSTSYGIHQIPGIPERPKNQKVSSLIPSYSVPFNTSPTWRNYNGLPLMKNDSRGRESGIKVRDFSDHYYSDPSIWESYIFELISQFWRVIVKLSRPGSVDSYFITNFPSMRDEAFSHYAVYIGQVIPSNGHPGILVCKFLLVGGRKKFPDDGIIPSLGKDKTNVRLLSSDHVYLFKPDFFTAFILSADQAVSG